jgi:hypothetical protein
MIFGSGNCEITLLDSAGQSCGTIQPERPTRREKEDWEEVYQDLGTDLDGRPARVLRGYRYHGRYVWFSSAVNQSAMAQVLRIGNWTGGGRWARLSPHVDYKGILLPVTIESCELQPIAGKVGGEEIAIEFLGRDLLAQKPNPLIDILGGQWHRRGIQ